MSRAARKCNNSAETEEEIWFAKFQYHPFTLAWIECYVNTVYFTSPRIGLELIIKVKFHNIGFLEFAVPRIFHTEICRSQNFLSVGNIFFSWNFISPTLDSFKYGISLVEFSWVKVPFKFLWSTCLPNTTTAYFSQDELIWISLQFKVALMTSSSRPFFDQKQRKIINKPIK